MAEQKKKKKSFGRRLVKSLFDFGVFILIVLVLTYLISAFVAQRVLVHNVSMQDTLTEGDVLIMDKLTYRIRDPKRYEIICFNSDYEREGLIKRVIGLPGETVMISEGMIFINGNQVKDVKGLPKIEDPGLAANEIHLGNDEYFVVGDNREKSIDSRSAEIGNVKRDEILGKAALRIYPFDRFGLLKQK
ncbi:MAG: signal peptidase I [Lachnospiraceae bacterium]|nr:signal peptidase I [Lachnospiraceae bacterium]